MPLDELRIANDLLRIALDRYANACLSVKNSLADELSQPIGPVLTSELSMLKDYETKLHESKTVISQSANLCPDIVPLCRIPLEILVHIFQLTVDMGRPSKPHRWAGVPKYPLKLTHVCTFWRQVVRNSPSLWSRVILYPNPGTSKQLESYIDFYSSQAKEARMDISIFNSPDREGPETYDSSAFMIPTSFSGRIRSLEARLFIPRDSTSKGTDAESLLAECLLATGKTLQRFELSVAFEPSIPVPPDEDREDPEPPDRRILKIKLPDELGDALCSITNLSLKGAYFNWRSRAYHGLVSLRLDPSTDSPPISQLELVNILESSPRLRFIDIDMIISRAADAPDLLPVHLPDLELLVGDVSLLRLIRPGSNELTVTITNCKPKPIYEALVKGFFSCANLVNFCSMNFLEEVSEVCHLLSMTPRLRGLGLTDFKLEGVLPDLTPHTLDTLYLLDKCTVERYFLEDVIEMWGLRRVVLPRESYYVRGEEPTPTVWIDNHFSELSARGIQLEVVPEPGSWDPPMGLFLGPFHEN